MRKRINVRCCCQPQKILGTVEVPDNGLHNGRFLITFSNIGPIAAVPPTSEPTVLDYERHEILIKDFLQYGSVVERAVYSDDRPIEFWRKVPSFKEATPA